jgi:hypothetical protein
MSFTRYEGDPFWIRAKFNSKCKCCGGEIKKGDDILYYPKTKSVYCDGAKCGEREYTQFRAIAEDEEAYMAGRGV